MSYEVNFLKREAEWGQEKNYMLTWSCGIWNKRKHHHFSWRNQCFCYTDLPRMSTDWWISPTRNSREEPSSQDSFCTFHIIGTAPTLQSCVAESTGVCAHAPWAPRVRIHFVKIPAQIFLAWHGRSDITQQQALPLLFSRYSWDYPTITPCWLELASGRPAPLPPELPY